MEWIKQFDFFLFDLDGLLVDTERLHFNAYKEMCHRRGFNLDWSFSHYLRVAHSDLGKLKEEIYHDLTGLYEEEPFWPLLYEEKKKIYFELLKKDTLNLMPGVFDLLTALQKTKKNRCVVTNSLKNQADLIKKKLPILSTIPYWITRDLHGKPKPHPEGYLMALKQFGNPTEGVVGFEDSIKGLTALQEAAVSTTFLICRSDYLLSIEKKDIKSYCYSSLEEIRYPFS